MSYNAYSWNKTIKLEPYKNISENLNKYLEIKQITEKTHNEILYLIIQYK